VGRLWLTSRPEWKETINGGQSLKVREEQKVSEIGKRLGRARGPVPDSESRGFTKHLV